MANSEFIIPFDNDATLLAVSVFLQPPCAWQLRLLSPKICQVLSSEGLRQFQTHWDLSGLPSLVDLVRVADPSAPIPQQVELLQSVGALLLARPGSASVANEAMQTSISWAADYGLEDVLRLLLGPLAFPQKSDALLKVVHLVEKNGWYPLYRAAWNGRHGCAKLLLVSKADAEGMNHGRYSPLIAAARWGHEKTVAVLLDARADPARKNSFGEDALSLAHGQGHLAVQELLKKHLERQGVDCDMRSRLGHVSTNSRHTLGQGWWNLGSEFYSDGDVPETPSPFARVG